MLKRSQLNPILTRHDIPEIHPNFVDVSSVFNPGAIRFKDKILLMLRVQNRGRETGFVKAVSEDGIHFQVDNKLVVLEGFEQLKERVYHCYDARLSYLDGKYYLMFAMDMDGKCSLGVALTTDFESYQFLGICSSGDIRNGVLFPERINGKLVRLDRPNDFQLESGPTSGSVICLSGSEDMLHWKHVAPLLTGRFHYWDELIGPGSPPIKTHHGWLCLYHGVATHFGSSNIYQAGVFLLDLHDPKKVIARSRFNILEPRELYELTGQVPNVVFPSGAIVCNEDADGFALDDSEVLIYYGAADTAIGLASTSIAELLTSMTPV